MFTAIIVDDHPMINGAVRGLLEKVGEFRVLAECTSGTSGLAAAREMRPDLLIIDLDIPLLGGVEVVHRLRQSGESMAILMISAGDEVVNGVRAFRAGADGFVHKSAAMTDISMASQLVVRGKIYFDKEIMAAAANVITVGQGGPLSSLGKREFEVFRCLAQGMSNIDIARHMMISNKTVSAHKKNVMDKLGLANIRDLIDLARSSRILR
ncbi:MULTISPECIES: response regulator transcription factor [Dyella]|uniref:Response regulator transcription factor n=2 Tax=Dyella TaxID=231454 RepID=A0A4R0YVA4_9GAMM|nr:MULTISPECIES: response regulator transcription factor [Dyella]TBR39043.1 response regulator transcription factor [Dyella terrae]TCI13365.1 response regulator transcription factor [Dyella soli]